MNTMKAVVFKGKDRIAVEEVAEADARSGRGGDPDHGDDDLRHRRAHRPRRVSGQARADPRPRARRRHRGARARTRSRCTPSVSASSSARSRRAASASTA